MTLLQFLLTVFGDYIIDTYVYDFTEDRKLWLDSSVNRIDAMNILGKQLDMTISTVKLDVLDDFYGKTLACFEICLEPLNEND